MCSPACRRAPTCARPGRRAFAAALAGGALVDVNSRRVPAVADRLAFHIPAPGSQWPDTDVEAGSDESIPLNGRVGHAVHAYAPGDERVERHHDVDDQGELPVAVHNHAYLTRVENGFPVASDPK